MPYKDPLRKKEWQRRYNAEHKDRHRGDQMKRLRQIRGWFREYKMGLKCSECGENHPACLEFHHKNGKEDKINNISIMVHDGHSISNIQREIKKCEILCANCHRKKTYGVLV